MMQLVGRTGLARILGVSENTTRNLETRGEIAPEAIVDGRPIYSVEKAKALKAKRDSAKRGQVLNGRAAA